MPTSAPDKIEIVEKTYVAISDARFRNQELMNAINPEPYTARRMTVTISAKLSIWNPFLWCQDKPRL
jgi:hypothetical protein